jgi:hypothetical protein
VSTALLHIGTHKTGTTAFQQWAFQHRRELAELRDIKLYDGIFGSNHVEFPLLCMRPNRTIRAQRRAPSRLDEWRQETKAHIRNQVADTAEHLLISAEGLSFLRYEDEVTALVELLQPRQLQVAVCLREQANWLASYRQSMKRAGDPPSPYPSSHRYVEPDTWLIRWDDMLDVWRAVLGHEHVVSFSYEESMARDDSTIPGVLEALAIDPAGLPSWSGLVANVTKDYDGSRWQRRIRRKKRR